MLTIEDCERVVVGLWLSELNQKSEASVWIDLIITSARKWVVEPPVTVGSVSDQLPVSHDISFDSSFAAMELSAIKPWLVRPTKGSKLTVALTCSVFSPGVMAAPRSLKLLSWWECHCHTAASE